MLRIVEDPATLMPDVTIASATPSSSASGFASVNALVYSGV